MSRAVHRELPDPPAPVNRRLAFSVFAPPLAWFVHEVVGVSIVGRQCDDGLAWWQWTVHVVVSLTAAGVSVSSAVVAYRIFAAWTRDGSPLTAQGWNRVEFVSLLGMFLSGFLLLNIIYFGVIPFMVDACARSI